MLDKKVLEIHLRFFKFTASDLLTFMTWICRHHLFNQCKSRSLLSNSMAMDTQPVLNYGDNMYNGNLCRLKALQAFYSFTFLRTSVPSELYSSTFAVSFIGSSSIMFFLFNTWLPNSSITPGYRNTLLHLSILLPKYGRCSGSDVKGFAFSNIPAQGSASGCLPMINFLRTSFVPASLHKSNHRPRFRPEKDLYHHSPFFSWGTRGMTHLAHQPR